MRNKLSVAVIITLSLVMFVGSANAMVISAVPGTPQNATSVTDLVTSLGMVGNLQVTATFANGTNSTLTWSSTVPYPYNYAGSSYAGVTGADWNLVAAGNTYAALWQFNGGASAITSLVLGGGNIAFDRTSPAPGTSGSFLGRDFSPDLNNDGSTDSPDWTVTYFNAIGLNGSAPVGDLFAGLRIDFGSGYSGNFSFLQDTDTFVPGSTGGGGTPPGGGGTPVPEPATLMLIGTGIAGLGFAKRLAKR